MEHTTLGNPSSGNTILVGRKSKRTIVTTVVLIIYIAAVSVHYASRTTIISIPTVPRFVFNNSLLLVNKPEQKNETSNRNMIASTPASTRYIFKNSQLPANYTEGNNDQRLPKNGNSTFLLCTYQIGGLGNQMFQFASAYGIAVSKDMFLRIHKSSIVAHTFKIPKIFIYENNHYCDAYKHRHASIDCGYDPNLSNFSTDSNYKVGIYIQSWLYFNHSMNAVRKHFTFKDVIRNQAMKLLKEMVLHKHNLTTRTDNVLVGVHIRRGNMLDHPYGYNVATSKYLQDAVKHFTSQKFSKLIFVVCSNDMEWSKRHMPGNITFELMTGNTAAVDMAILSLCNHTITTVGTFGWWSAFLAGGQTTYFKWPAKEGSDLRKQFSKTYSDFFYPSWIGF